MLVCWTERYAIGIDEIDEQHKEIFDMLNQMHDALGKKDASDDVVQVVIRLAMYVKKHFATEETIMSRIAYTNIEHHQARHRELTHEVQSLLLKMKRGETPSVRSVVALLKGWLLEHIEHEDQKIGAFVRAAARARETAGHSV